MDIPFYQIDAFTDRVFAGNPAGVCFLEQWLEDAVLQSIAAENNVSETAFLVPAGPGYELRWFTPKVEVDLCGHATLASAFAVFEYVNPQAERVDFQTQSGLLSVERQGDLLTMNFPARRPEPCAPPDQLTEILGIPPVQTYQARDLLVVYEQEDQVRRLATRHGKSGALGYLCGHRHRPGQEQRFCFPFFCSKGRRSRRSGYRIGPLHLDSLLVRTPRQKRAACLAALRTGWGIFCIDQGDRVSIGGKAAAYLSGTIRV